MKVLQVYKDYWPVVGGIENHVKRLAIGLNARPGILADVLVTARDGRTVRQKIDGVRVTKAGRLGTVSSAPISLELFREIGRRRYDVTHLHFPYPIGEMAYLFRGRSKKMVITYHSDIVRQKKLALVYRPFLEILLRRADAICVSNPGYALGSPFLRRFPRKLHVIHHGLDYERFDPTREVLNQAADLRKRTLSPRILFVGELRYYKGVDVLLRAMPRISGTLTIVGGGPEEAALRTLVGELGIVDRVEFAGRIPDSDLVAAYYSADVFVLPSTLRAESWGAVLLEAMACSLPLVTTELGTGTSFINIDGMTGRVASPSDPASLADALNDVLRDPVRRASFGAAARARLIDHFSSRRMVDETVSLYERLLT